MYDYDAEDVLYVTPMAGADALQSEVDGYNTPDLTELGEMVALINYRYRLPV